MSSEWRILKSLNQQVNPDLDTLKFGSYDANRDIYFIYLFIYLFKSKRLRSGVQSSTVCAASVKMSPSIEDSDSGLNEEVGPDFAASFKESDLNDDDGLNLAAARFIAWSIGESSPSDRIDENDPRLDSGFDEKDLSQ